MSIFDIINAKKYWISIKSELNAAQSFTSIAKFFKTKSYAFLASGSFSRKNSFRIGSWNVVCNILFPFLSFGFWISPIQTSHCGPKGFTSWQVLGPILVIQWFQVLLLLWYKVITNSSCALSREIKIDLTFWLFNSKLAQFEKMPLLKTHIPHVQLQPAAPSSSNVQSTHSFSPTNLS